MLGIPASLTRAIDFPSLRSLIILGIFFKELCLLKLIRLLVKFETYSLFFFFVLYLHKQLKKHF